MELYLDSRQEDGTQCGECGAEEGQLHQFLCFKERCPFCGGQLATCDCVYQTLQLYDARRWTQETEYLPPETYENGLNDHQLQEWRQLCEEKGRFPFIKYPLMCAYCGEKWPGLFMVPDEEWAAAVQPDMRSKILCVACFERISEQVRQSRLLIVGRSQPVADALNV